MFNPLGFASSAAVEAAAAAETCGCGCTGTVGVLVDNVIIIVRPVERAVA
jgi:hypothetical protein